MDFKDVYTFLGYILGAGGALALIREAFNYFSKKRKDDQKHEIVFEKLEDSRTQAVFDHLSKRLKDMEVLSKEQQDRYKIEMKEMQEAYRNCIKGEAAKEREIGHLTSRVEWLESLIPKMQAVNVDAAANQAANRVAKNVETVVGKATSKVEGAAAQVAKKMEAVVDKAVDKAVDKRMDGNSERFEK